MRCTPAAASFCDPFGYILSNMRAKRSQKSARCGHCALQSLLRASPGWPYLATRATRASRASRRRSLVRQAPSAAASSGRPRCIEVHDSVGGEILARFDGGPQDLLEERPVVRRELFREDDAERRCPGMRRAAQKHIPRGYGGRHYVDVKLQVNLRKAGVAHEIEQGALGIVHDRAFRALLFSVGKLRGLPSMKHSHVMVTGAGSFSILKVYTRPGM